MNAGPGPSDLRRRRPPVRGRESLRERGHLPRVAVRDPLAGGPGRPRLPFAEPATRIDRLAGADRGPRWPRSSSRRSGWTRRTSMRRAICRRCARSSGRRPPTATCSTSVLAIYPASAPNVASSTAQITYAELTTPPRRRAGDRSPPIWPRCSSATSRRPVGRRRWTSGRLYAIWSPVESYYGQEYGLERPSQSVRWRDLLLASPVVEGGVRQPRHIPVPSRGGTRRAGSKR